MTEKRFKVTDNTDNPFLCDWSVTDYGDGGIVHHPMTSENMANVICDLLNELHEENQELKQELHKIYELATVNKVRDIVENVYDDLLYETSDESDFGFV